MSFSDRPFEERLLLAAATVILFFAAGYLAQVLTRRVEPEIEVEATASDVPDY